MNKFFLRLSLLSLLAVAVAGTPAILRAQNTTNTTSAAKAPSRRVTPFHGRLKAIDKTGMTVSIGNETFQITSATKITKGGKPATLEDGAVGDEASGSYRKDAEGKLNAVSLRFGPKPPTPASTTKTNTP